MIIEDSEDLVEMIQSFDEIPDNNVPESIAMQNPPIEGVIPQFVAKKNHIINCNDEYYEFFESNSYDNIPKKWENTLITEGVI